MVAHGGVARASSVFHFAVEGDATSTQPSDALEWSGTIRAQGIVDVPLIVKMPLNAAPSYTGAYDDSCGV